MGKLEKLKEIMAKDYGITTDEQLMDEVSKIDLDLGIFVTEAKGERRNEEIRKDHAMYFGGHRDYGSPLLGDDHGGLCVTGGGDGSGEDGAGLLRNGVRDHNLPSGYADRIQDHARGLHHDYGKGGVLRCQA